MISILNFSKFNDNDFDNYFSLVSNEDVMKQIIGRPHTLAEAQEIFKETLANNALHADCGTFKITNNEGIFIGFVKLELEDATSNEAEIGYMLLPQFWGKGYGKQAAGFVLDLAHTIPQLKTLTANIDPENIASRKILTNVGFTHKEYFTWKGLPAELLAMPI